MRRAEQSSHTEGISISVPIPSRDPKLYSKEATDDVLQFLSTHRFEEFSQREVARRVDHSEAAVRRAVAVLEENELVVGAYRGNRKAISINRNRLSVPDDPILRIPQAEFQLPVETATEEIERELDDVVGIVLHGSVARGAADRRSDIDLWVAVRDDRARNQRTANSLRTELEDRAFDGQRYEFHITVESVDAVPAFTDDITHIIQSGIPTYKTEHFDKLKRILAHDSLDG